MFASASVLALSIGCLASNRRRGGGGSSPVPVKTANPSISSATLAVGDTATAVHGTYTGTITGYVQQWLRNGSPIPGATSLTYVFQTADAGQSVTYSEYAYYSSPVYSSATGTSNSLGPIVSSGGGSSNGISAPVLTRTTAANVNPMLVDIGLDATTHIYDAIASEDGTFDFLQMRRATSTAYASPVTDLVRLTQDMAVTDATFPNCLTNMPSGTTALSARIRRGQIPGRIINLGDSMTVNQYNWIYNYATANPGLELIRVASSGRYLSNTPDGNDLYSHIDEVSALAPSIVCGLISAGIDDTTNYPSATDFFNDLVAFWQALKAAIPNVKIAWCTILPTGTAVSDYAARNSRRAVVNPLIRAAVGTYIDAVVDFAADATVGPDAAANNATLYADGLHPSDGAQTYLTPIYTAAMNTLITAGNVWVDSPWSNDVTGTLDPAVAVATTTFDPTRKSQYAVLSNGNLTINGTNGVGAPTGAIGTSSHNSGDVYVEFTYSLVTAAGCGLCNNSYDPVVAHKFSYPPTGVYLNGNQVIDASGTPHSFAAGTFDNGVKVGFRYVAASSQVMVYANGTLEGTYAAPTGAVFPFATPETDTDTITMNCGQSALSYLPSGSSQWG